MKNPLETSGNHVFFQETSGKIMKNRVETSDLQEIMVFFFPDKGVLQIVPLSQLLGKKWG
jgi:hypothetical protein